MWVQVIGEEDLEQFMARMQQHVDRSKHNLNSLFEEVISSVEKDCTFRPSLEPTRAVRPPPLLVFNCLVMHNGMVLTARC